MTRTGPDSEPGSEPVEPTVRMGRCPLPLTTASSEEHIAVWDAEAPGFDEAADHGLLDPTVRAAWRRLLTEHLPSPPALVADLGCGTGTLSVLLAECGYRVDGLDFSPEMIRRAEAKARDTAEVWAADGAGVRFVRADAADPPLPAAAYDVVLSRHVLWAMPDPAVALARWIRLLRPEGTLLLVEGRWATGGGLTADRAVALVEATGRPARLTTMTEPVYWGRAIDDERYLVTSASLAPDARPAQPIRDAPTRVR